MNSGGLTIGVVATPGHTTEHVSYVLYEHDGTTARAVFSGGSMLVGGAGRTDLMGASLTDSLTRQQYHSLLRLLEVLPDGVLVYPTHGAGSFCVAGPASNAHHSTVAQERLVSPAMHARDEDDFVRRVTAGYGEYPAYYAHMRAINVAGPRLLAEVPPPAALDVALIQAHMREGVPLVDGRRRNTFAGAHVPGSINVELGSTFGTYVGWIFPFNSPIMLLLDDQAAQGEAVVQLLRIGYEAIVGSLEGGFSTWTAGGLPVEHFEAISVARLHELWSSDDRPAVLDVRRDEEWSDGHIVGSRHIHVADLIGRIEEVPADRPVAVICASGHRAEIAASILAAHGRDVIAVRGGVPDWLARGWPSEREERQAPPTDSAEHAHP
jgi:hydroxyacylglutathione hydrolase